MRQRRRRTGHGGRTRAGVFAGNADRIDRRHQHGVRAMRAGASAQTRLAAVGSVFSCRRCRHGGRVRAGRRGPRVLRMAWHVRVRRRGGIAGPRSFGIDLGRHLHGPRRRCRAIDGEQQAQQNAQQDRPGRHAPILPPRSGSLDPRPASFTARQARPLIRYARQRTDGRRLGMAGSVRGLQPLRPRLGFCRRCFRGDGHGQAHG
jgi:hypothetical protein